MLRESAFAGGTACDRRDGAAGWAWRGLCIGLIAAVLLASVVTIPASAAEPKRRVNAPYFASGIIPAQSGLFWFGRVTPTENYADVRVGYNANGLMVMVSVADRRLWYDTSPAAADLEAWDAVTIYLDTDRVVGTVPDASSYRFVAQLNWWEPRAGYQAAYRGTGTGWALTPLGFTASTVYRGDQPNNSTDDRGWVATFTIPFTSLGLSGAPAAGALWQLGVALHDRDDSGGTAIPIKVWPETLSSTKPATWGELELGLPRAYAAKPYVPSSEQTTMIRDRLNGITVVDGAVGGHTACGAGLDYWTEWGEKTYTGLWTFNIQNAGDISDWPCFSRYYVSFPTSPVPPGKVILRAVLTLYQFGGAGAGWLPPAQPSLIQAFTIRDAWDQNTLAWNNAPLAAQFVAWTWVAPTTVYLGQPGLPWHWDVTSALAEAYAAGKPMDLAFYEADTALHAGKYFRASEEEEFDAVGRPTLVVTWGNPVAELHSYAWPTQVKQGDRVVFTMVVQGAGAPLRLTSTLPGGIGVPVSLSTGISLTPDHSAVSWEGAPAYGSTVTLSFAAIVTQTTTGAITSRTALTQTSPQGLVVKTSLAATFVNPLLTYLPVYVKTGR